MQVRLLGPVEIVGPDQASRPVSGLRRKAVLAVLALRAGEIVSADRIIEAVWGQDAATAVNTLQTNVSYLRRVLGDPAAIVARAPGYLLDLGPDGTDAAVAERLIQSAQQCGDLPQRVELLRSALALWRGRPLVDVAGLPWLAAQSDRLAALAADARRSLVEARLALGEHADLLPELRQLAAEHPFDEQAQGRLVLALYRSGRQADALVVLREVRARLANELGIDPGPALQELEAAVLRQSPGLAPAATTTVRTRPAGGGLLVGRRDELSTLTRLLDPRGDEAAPVVAVSGDPGIGKTSLLREFARRAQMSGRAVAWGRAAEYEQHVPFAVLADALADLEMPPGNLPFGDAAALREILPMTGTPTGAVPPPVLGGERYRLHRAVRGLLEYAAGSAGLLIVLDDLHWADPGSAELLEHLLRHPPAGPVLVAVSYRPRQLPGRLRDSLGRAVVDGVARALELGPLARADIDGLLPERLSTSRRHELYQASGGNPFYLQALARSDLGVSAVRPEAGDPLPAHVRAALAAELGALAPVEAKVAWAAALAPEVAEPELVARTAELSVREVLDALDLLVARDILRAGPVHDRFQFRHPLLRQATYEATDPGWRVGAHARAAETLRQRGAAPAEQAHHLERCAARGDLTAVEMLQRAGTDALDSNPGVAGHWFGAALRLLPDTMEAAGPRMELLVAQAQALAVTGRLRESRQSLHDLLHLIPAAAAEPRASLVALCAGIERLLGRHAEANAQLAAELAALPADEERAAAILLLGIASDFTSGFAGPGRSAEAIAAARKSGDRPLLAAALATSVLNAQWTGRPGPGTGDRLTEAAELVDAMPDAEVAQLLHGVAWLATAELCHDRPYDAQRHAERALQAARTSGQTTLAGQIHALRACVHRALGDLPSAARCLEDARDAVALIDTDELTSLVLAYQCTVTALQGDLDLALRLGKEAVAVAGARRDYFAGMAAGALAQALLQAGDPDECVAVLLGFAGADNPQLTGIDPLSRSGWYLMLTEAEAARGRPERALDWADRAREEAALIGTHRQIGSAQLARAYALLPTDPAEAAECAEAALKSLTEAADPIGAGLASLTLGVISGSADHFARAAAVFTRCGTHLLVARARR